MASSFVLERQWQSAKIRTISAEPEPFRSRSAHPLGSYEALLTIDQDEQDILEEMADILEDFQISSSDEEFFTDPSLERWEGNAIRNEVQSPCYGLPALIDTYKEERQMDSKHDVGQWKNLMDQSSNNNNETDDLNLPADFSPFEPSQTDSKSKEKRSAIQYSELETIHDFLPNVPNISTNVPVTIVPEFLSQVPDLLTNHDDLDEENDELTFHPSESQYSLNPLADNDEKEISLHSNLRKTSKSLPSMKTNIRPDWNATTRSRYSSNAVAKRRINTVPVSDPKLALQNAIKCLNSSDWEMKMDGIKTIIELSSTNSEVIQSEIHATNLALLVEVRNLRSQVSRAAIQALRHLFEHCGKAMEQDLERTVHLLLHKTGDTNRFIRDDAHVTLMAMTVNVSPPKAIAAIVTEGASHKNAIVRCEAANLLAIIIERMGGSKALSGARDVTEKVLPAAAQFVQEGSQETRAHAKRIFYVLVQEPLFDKAMNKYLTASQIRNVQRIVDTIKKNGLNGTYPQNRMAGLRF